MDAEAQRRIFEEERFRRSLQSKSKPLGLILTFFFPVIGFLYTTNYIWAAIFLVLDIMNFFLTFVGVGIFSGLLVRIIAVFIANYGIDRHRARLLENVERRTQGDVPSTP
jgi:hypothetical protein